MTNGALPRAATLDLEMRDGQFLKRIALDVTGGRAYRHALFYEFPGGLRFELSESGDGLSLVLTALRKALVVCDDVFSERPTVIVHLQAITSSSAFTLRCTLRELAAAGIAMPRQRHVWCDVNDESGDRETGFLVHCAFEVPVAMIQNLLWCALVLDFPGVRPNPQCQVYLIDPVSRVIVHPYDDRGMDVVCGESAVLQALYEKHQHWLLDYDRAAMDLTFGANSRGQV